MNFVYHRNCNGRLLRGDNSPDLVDERPLPVQRCIIAEDATTRLGTPAIRHFWQPTPEELAALNANGRVYVESFGQTIAPVYVGVIDQ